MAAEKQRQAKRREGPAVVGIGASAGGVLALQALFGALPAKTGAAYVVIVHLDPNGTSELANIIASRTRMPVAQVDGPTRLEADHVYVIPPDRQLHVSDHEIAALAFEEPRGQRAPIDLFFRSLAEVHDDGFAVILTGAGADGALGVRAVKEAGGIILVQNPKEAEYPSMPRNAVATGVADFILPILELAAKLTELLQNEHGALLAEDQAVDEDLLRRILGLVRQRTGNDFSKYKRSTVLRRIARRMQITGADALGEYHDLLRENAGEAQALLADFLISVTSFFRDVEAFEALKTEVLPRLFEIRESSQSVRVWVPGCATGEEVYSIGILLLEEAALRNMHPTLQVFGSDLDGRALTIAREGRYPAAIEADVSDERLRRFFIREGEHYRARRELRDTVLFASHNLLKDPPFSRIDLISCRNLMIYLDRELQQQACGTFHYALNPSGYLFLGASESADSPSGLFAHVNRKARIYRSTERSGDKPRLLPRLLASVGPAEHLVQPGRPLSPSGILSEAALHRQAIERVAPPSLLVDSALRVVHLSENAGRYLQPAGGPLSGDVVDLARSELRFELRSALNRVFEHGQTTLSLPIMVRFNGSAHRMHIFVRPAGEEGEGKPQNAIVMFLEGEEVGQPALPESDRAASDEMVRRLNEELRLTQARLSTTREESEAANEALRAANEELQSMNEEYRSTSEELETSKEELQSINEELQTVNSELKLKLEAVSRAHSDLQNLMSATDIGTLFLDANLRIKRFTDQVTDLIRITHSDEGRPVTDFAHVLKYDDFVKDVQTVLAHPAPIRREVFGQNGHCYDVRLHPYRTAENKADGVVITFVDISERLRVEQALRTSERSLRHQKSLVELAHDPILIWDFDGGIVEWNRGSQELYGFTREEALGEPPEQLLSTIPEGVSFAEVRETLLRKGNWQGEVKQRTKGGHELVVESRIILEAIDGRRLALESARDITGRKELERRQYLLLGELTHRVKNTLAVVQSIAQQTMRGRKSPTDMVATFDGRLISLAGSHGLLVASDWKGTDFMALAKQQLAPYGSDNPKRIQLAGDAVNLSASLATPFGLVLHELATNAVKHGTLGKPKGSVQLTWSVSRRRGERTLTVVWKELGKPRSKPSKRIGFGATLIDRGIPRAQVKREMKPQGLICTIKLPLTEL
jgi:two-component system CheB/CheR fusion protein